MATNTVPTEDQISSFGQNDDFWIFGYGSLIWKPPPHYDQRIPGYIENYVRRFWQARWANLKRRNETAWNASEANWTRFPGNSEDHRGTPEAPGRVVTLIDRAHWETLTDHHASTEKVWGAAYHIPASHVAAVREYLDIREINGYSIQFTPFYPANSSSLSPSPPSTASTRTAPITTLVYIGLPENPQFTGPQDPDSLAAHILRSRGPSGENKEYLYLLEESLERLSPESGDRHVSDLAARARAIEGRERKISDKEKGSVVVSELQKLGSVDEQEEVEK